MKELHPLNSPKARATANNATAAREHWLKPLRHTPIPQLAIPAKLANALAADTWSSPDGIPCDITTKETAMDVRGI